MTSWSGMLRTWLPCPPENRDGRLGHSTWSRPLPCWSSGCQDLDGSSDRAYEQRKRWRLSVDLFEYQAKELFAEYGVPVQAGQVARTAEEARVAAAELAAQGHSLSAVKTQRKAGTPTVSARQ